MLALLVLAAATAAASASGSMAAKSTISPCRQVRLPAWSPDGTQIVYYGRRWPAPGGHGNPNSILQALCTMKPDGTNAQPLDHTVCSENCPDPPGEIVWLQRGIVYLRDGAIYRLTPGSKPVKVMRFPGESFTVDAAGDRIAAGQWSGCVRCAGPISVYDLSTGRRVGTAGGKKLDNLDPTLSADGSQVAFERNAANGSGKTYGIWTATAKGRHLRQLLKVGNRPAWSPVAAKIAYVSNFSSLRLISARGGKARILVRRNVQNVFGWSPNGRYVAVEIGRGTYGKLSVVDVKTGKVRSLLQMYTSPYAAWAPDSTELVANYVPKTGKGWSTWRVPVDGSKPVKISSSG